MIIEAAMRAVASGMGKDVLPIIHYIIDRMSFFIVPDTLEYLHRGGRVSAVAAMLGNLLQIKPILYFNKARNNVVEVLERVRTKEKGLQRILEEMKKQGPNIRVYAGHVAAEVQGRALVERIQSIFPGLSPDLLQVGPVIGTHAGPGTLGLVFYPLKRLRSCSRLSRSTAGSITGESSPLTAPWFSGIMNSGDAGWSSGQLVGLITRRSLVRIQPPLPI